jgi:triphosphoribosyl-dephospho-CoA synthase
MSATTFELSQHRVARAFRGACLAELRAFKPGNVSSAAPGHGMNARDFVLSARAAGPALMAPADGVGARILAAVQATRAVVDCNTNLGIILLCAPLAHAALSARTGTPLRRRLGDVLAGLDRRDAESAYRAIRLAAPGGLGSAPAHDVHDEPGVTLLHAMKSAASWDRIAFQYAHGYPDVFDFGVAHFQAARARLRKLSWAVVSLYLAFLSRVPDSHVVRRHGMDLAEEISHRAEAFSAELSKGAISDFEAVRLREFDVELKRRGINPGTTADLTVATLFAWWLEDGPRASGRAAIDSAPRASIGVRVGARHA